ncbi:MAG: monovalent cation/H+ antiporter subunit D [Methyloversatilis sp.]|jgi:multicomponent K+:H+ antiporter subunit D|nr:monovalent cation/H+ antiporter subunit D [Methyloversatilis sp.]
MRALAQALMPHLIIAPILLPLLTACLLLLLDGRRHRIRGMIGLAAALANLVIAALLLSWAGSGHPTAYGVYLPSNWDMPFGIVLVADRLSALLLLTAAIVALMALLFAVARWHKAGAHFHPLFQIQIMGLNGAFLTGDLFNLFVFFEVMLAASYGLLLHGSGPSRVRTGLHYLAINLVASSLFLIGAALIYGVTGTLNMADIAARIPQVASGDRALLHAGFAVLGVAFLAKAATWPLNFWLVPAYAAASAPAAAIFALLTKVGVYVLLRFSTLMFSEQAGASAGFGSDWLLWGGTATLAAGAFGMFSTQRPGRLAGFAVIVSSGTLLAVLGLARPELTAGALYYLPSSTLGVAAFFLLAELMERSRSADVAGARAPEDEEDHLPFPLAELELDKDVNLDEDEEMLIGHAIPAATALLGLAFICCTLLVAGLPPLSSFIGKFVLLSALVPGLSADTLHVESLLTWVLPVLIVVSGLCALVALSRVGIRFFWTPVDREAPLLRVVEFVPIALLVTVCIVMSVRAEPVMRYATATAEALYHPAGYIDAVLSARPRPTPTNAERLGLQGPEATP